MPDAARGGGIGFVEDWHHGLVSRRLASLMVIPFVGILVGCGQAQEAATGAASSAASQAASRATTAAGEEVKRQICSRVQDGQLSGQDVQVLSGLVSVAESAGVSPEVTAPLKELARAGDQVPAESVRALREACGLTPSST